MCTAKKSLFWVTAAKKNPLLLKICWQMALMFFLQRPLKFGQMTETIQGLPKMKKDLFSGKAEITPSDRDADMKFLKDSSKPAMEKIELMVGYVNKMLAFPFTVAKVVSVTSDANSGAGGLAKAIEADPVISATILKVSNTVLFASRDKEITSVKDAIIRIGFMETRNIALSLSVITTFDNDQANFGFDRKRLSQSVCLAL